MKLGIDLGTSNSSVAFFDSISGEPVNTKVSTGHEPYDSILRSCSLLTGSGVIIGSAAERQYQANPGSGRFISSLKPYLNETHLRRKIGTRQRFVMSGYSYHTQEPIWEEVHDDVFIGGEFSKSELMKGMKQFFGEILTKSRTEIVQRGEECHGYLLGVPLNGKLHYRFRLLEVLKRANPFADSFRAVFQKATFIPEPVAVSFCYHETFGPEDKRVLIFDYGGGTLDLALLEYEQIEDVILPTRLLGLNCLEKAGDYINDVLKRYIMTQYPGYKERYDDLDPVRRYFEDQQIESVKIRLSTEGSVQVKLMSGAEIRISKDEFAEVLSDSFREIDDCIEGCFIDARVDDFELIDKVIMSGGSSLIPAVQEHIRELFGKEKVIASDPGGIDSVETSLTGVSRGLAKYDYYIALSGLQTNRYQLWDQNQRAGKIVLERNQVEGAVKYDPRLEGYRGASLCLFYNMIKEEPLVALINVPYKPGDIWTVKLSQNNLMGSLPNIVVHDDRGSLVASIDFSKFSEEAAQRMITEADWTIDMGGSRSWEMPCVPIEVGNFIRVNDVGGAFEVEGEYVKDVPCLYHETCKRGNKPMKCKDKDCNDGIISARMTGIREIDTGRFLKTTNHWDLSRFAFELKKEHTTVTGSFHSHEVEVTHK